ncbi:Na/Pi cotransporter family protein [Dubosiella newyorkensis]|jgi:phosphate:Na+ symporter|uniref:Na/Pi cotransporter family protein n=1 Tax=Dubosiella newyorkensis TaxID=1862672 RepID=UPI00235255A4|nr:Na/Pi cotransporter family protein [Dubosiella newyorkensis]MCI9040327.1 Na/Pi cotransporter family protein [Dubosiella newyorkensis]
MNLDIVKSVLAFGGGLGMFIYGMQLMADGLQKAAGAKTRNLLGILTNNRLIGVLVGALITAIIQSSSATTVMVVGFVNAGLMNLSQAIGVIMGANIGTTMTGWLVSMSEWGSIFKPDFFAPILLIIGTILFLFSKKDRVKEVAGILVGFGILFIGLGTMSGAIKPYSEEPIFYQAFTIIGSNPIFGLLVGAIVTAVIQSSSASMGILQTLAFNGVVNWGAAAFIALGQNIGTCVTALLSCIGANQNAKRAATLHLLFNIIGSLIVGTVIWIYFALNPAVAASNVSGTSLALFHTGFNIVTTVLLFPFANLLVKIAKRIIPAHEEESARRPILDDRLLETPLIALQTVFQEILNLGSMALESITYSRDLFFDESAFEKLSKNKAKIKEYKNEITNYLEKFDASYLTPEQQLQMQHSILALNNIERISVYCSHIMDRAKDMLDIKISENEREDINTISHHAYKTLKYALRLREEGDVEVFEKVEKHEDSVDAIETDLRSRYMKRMLDNRQGIENGILFLDVIDYYESISDHAERLARYTLQEA